MIMHDPLPIIPFAAPPQGNVHLPGSKSITNRALVLAALSPDFVHIQNASFCQDTYIMIDALRTLGFFIEADTNRSIISVQGLGGIIPKSHATINVGNAGTVARFLPAIVCLNPEGVYYFDGSAVMRKRPIKPLLDALESIGAATVFYHEKIGHFPFTIKTQGLKGGSLVVDNTWTSQVLSALLMIAPFTQTSLTIHYKSKSVSWAFVDMTLKMMQHFCPFDLPKAQDDAFHFTNLGSYSLPSKNYCVEPDASAASYFFALIWILGGQINIPNLSLKNSIQGDSKFARILEAQGLSCEEFAQGLHVTRSPLPNLIGQYHNFETFSDTFLTLAAIAPLLKGPTHITGIAHTRFQECDRLSVIADQLKKLNQKVIEKKDSLTIIPQPIKPATIDVCEDHRIAMSFAILGSFDLLQSGQSWLSINNPGCCAKTFPTFFDTLNNLSNTHTIVSHG